MPNTDACNTFTRAIVRRPGQSFVDAITGSSHLGGVDLDLALEQHDAYIASLEQAGLDVTVLDADERYPDGTFVEDIAVVAPELVVITHPGAESRQGEQHVVEEVLADRKFARIDAPATLEGGDVMRIGDTFYVGASGRTDDAGIAQFAEIMTNAGYQVGTIPVTGCLHLKTDVTFIGNNTVIATSEFATRPEFAGMTVIEVSDADSYAANWIAINDSLLAPAGFDSVRDRVIDAGFDASSIIEVPMTEFRKVDGGLTCLSLRF
jgi:dimethylargininase